MVRGRMSHALGAHPWVLQSCTATVSSSTPLSHRQVPRKKGLFIKQLVTGIHMGRCRHARHEKSLKPCSSFPTRLPLSGILSENPPLPPHQSRRQQSPSAPPSFLVSWCLSPPSIFIIIMPPKWAPLQRTYKLQPSSSQLHVAPVGLPSTTLPVIYGTGQVRKPIHGFSPPCLRSDPHTGLPSDPADYSTYLLEIQASPPPCSPSPSPATAPTHTPRLQVHPYIYTSIHPCSSSRTHPAAGPLVCSERQPMHQYSATCGWYSLMAQAWGTCQPLVLQRSSLPNSHCFLLSKKLRVIRDLRPNALPGPLPSIYDPALIQVSGQPSSSMTPDLQHQAIPLVEVIS